MHHELTYQASLAHIDDMRQQAAAHRLAAQVSVSRRPRFGRQRMPKFAPLLRPRARVA